MTGFGLQGNLDTHQWEACCLTCNWVATDTNMAEIQGRLIAHVTTCTESTHSGPVVDEGPSCV